MRDGATPFGREGSVHDDAGRSESGRAGAGRAGFVHDGAPLVAGVDEAGRGPLAGCVVAAAVVLPADLAGLEGLADSKTLSEARREALAEAIRARCLYGVGVAEPAEIDAVNILEATMRAMARAVGALPRPPARILVDGNRTPELGAPADPLVGGDALEPAIAAASIIAKTVRDDLMRRAAARFPGYGFESHKGYGSPAHLKALAELGPCPIHRRSFAPVRDRLACNDRGPALAAARS